MHKLILGMAAIACASGIAVAAETKYTPHRSAGATPVAYQSQETQPCNKDRSVLACVVQLGPNQNDRWAYMLEDANGMKNAEVKYREAVSGSTCAAMAYPVGHVVLAGGMGEWFNGKVEYACRQ